MRVFDPKFKENVPRYILQCLLAMIIIFVVLLLDDAVFSMTIVASLGASTFIALTMPHTNASRPRYLIGGYVVGAACGVLMNYACNRLLSVNFQVFGHSPYIISCAAAVGLAMFVMVITDTEHPPAAALSMGLVAQTDVVITALTAVAGIVIICSVKAVLKKRLKNLL